MSEANATATLTFAQRLVVSEAGHASSSRASSIRIADLFAGIGGMRRAFESVGARCLFSAERDEFARRTYEMNLAAPCEIAGDIRDVCADEIPDHDVLLAGFPCQPFSSAGVPTKNSLGQSHGFLDRTQGTLFFSVAEILAAKQPRGFLLENVKNLKAHDGGKTFRTIMEVLAELGYQTSYAIIDGRGWVPQHRERMFIVGFRDGTKFSFDRIRVPRRRVLLESILHTEDEEPEEPYTLRRSGRTVVADRYVLSDRLWGWLQAHAKKHASRGNGFGYSVFHPSDVARTLSARYYKDGSEILIHQRARNPRRLTPRECARLMGFESRTGPRMRIPVSDTQAYKQFGNSVVVPAVAEIAKAMLAAMDCCEESPVETHGAKILVGGASPLGIRNY